MQRLRRRHTRPVNAPALAEASTIRAFFLAPLVRELDDSGVPIDTFLRRYGLSAAQLTRLYEPVPLRHFVALAEDAADRLQRPFLGLELGGRFTPADLGPFYAMFILARDLRSALECLGRFQSVWQTNTTLELISGANTASYRYLIEDPSIWPRRQDSEFAMATFTSFIRKLTSARWRPMAVEFEHDVSDRAETLKEFFMAPVYGNRGANQLVISSEDIEKPLRHRIEAGAQDVVPILERHLLEILAPPTERSKTVAARADALIARRLGRGAASIEAIAAEMGMSVRSLRRHLSAEGTSFRHLLQEHRRTAVEAILRSDGGRLSDLASRVSYSDSAVLSRAFKAWTGQSPRSFLKSRKR
jgi:AraC-like DNA-binding protein